MYFHTEAVKLCLTFCTVTKKTDSDTLPVAGTHRETFASRDEVLSVRTIKELMAVLLTVVGDTEVDRGWDFRIGSNVRIDYLPLAVGLDKNALRTDANASEQLSRTEDTCIAVAGSSK